MSSTKIISQYSLEGDLIETYGSLEEASSTTGIDKGNISRAYVGKATSAGGFNWVKEDLGKKPKQYIEVASIKLYDTLSEEVKKQWYSRHQLYSGYPKYFSTDKSIYSVDKSEWVRKREFAVQTKDYKSWLLNGEGEFYGTKYRIEKFYYFEDVEKNLDDRFEEVLWYTELKTVKTTQLSNLQSALTDRDNLLEPIRTTPVVFYGEKSSTSITDASDTYRLYYGLFFLRGYIEKMFCEVYKIKRAQLEAILFVFNYKFISRSDFTNFYNSHIPTYATNKKYSPLWSYLLKNNYIKLIKYKESSMYNQTKGFNTRFLHRITSKGEKLAELYMDYVLYKRKFDYEGLSLEENGVSYMDIKNRTLRSRGNLKQLRPKNFMLYEYVYQYVNFLSEVKFTDDDALAQAKKFTSAEFPYNPFIYKMVEKNHLSDGINMKYIKAFLESNSWGYKVD